MNSFYTLNALENHKVKCGNHEYCEVKLTSGKYQKTKLKFTNYHFRNVVPFVMYADFESINVQPEQTEVTNWLANGDSDKVISLLPQTEDTKIITQQIPAVVGLYIYSDYQKLVKDIILAKTQKNGFVI